MDHQAGRKLLREKLPVIVREVNRYLKGCDHDQILQYILPFEQKRKQPLWLKHIEAHGKPDRDNSKSWGTYIEKLLKAEMARTLAIRITGSAAKGVDIPELQIGLKATSDKNPQSSEPLLSAYQRILGSTHDILVVIYNGTEFNGGDAKHLCVVETAWFTATQLADKTLCETARHLQKAAQKHTPPVEEEVLKRCLRLIAYVNRQGRRLPAYYRRLEDALKIVSPDSIRQALAAGERETMPQLEPPLPTPADWKTFLKSPLDGKISVSFALQWRYHYPGPDRPAT